MLAFAFVFSAEIVTIIYTGAYVAAAPVMRIYILGLIALVIEPATLMLLLRQGAFSMRLGVLALALSVTLSWTCASAGGLAGAAVGSVTAIYLEHVGALCRSRSDSPSGATSATSPTGSPRATCVRGCACKAPGRHSVSGLAATSTSRQSAAWRRRWRASSPRRCLRRTAMR